MHASSTSPSPSWSERLPASRLHNVALVGVFFSLALGAALAGWAPRTLWRVGSPTPLGDFSLLVACAVVGWSLLASPAGRSRLSLAALAVVLPLVLREVLWRWSAGGFALSMLYATSFGLAVVLPLGRNLAELHWARRCGRALQLGEPPLDLASGIGWLLVLDLTAWLGWAVATALPAAAPAS